MSDRINNNVVIWESFSPWAPSPPMKRMEMTRANTDGSNVRNGARIDRKITSNSTRMNRIENSCTVPPVLLEPVALAAFVATSPARWNSRPEGARARAKVSCSWFTIVVCVGWSIGLTRASTRICVAWPSDDVPIWCAASTSGTRRTEATSRMTAASSRAVSGNALRDATMKIWLSLDVPPCTGTAKLAAFELGALAGRNLVLSLLTSLDADGSALDDTTASTIHSSTTR